MIAICKYWYKAYGAVPAVFTSDIIEFYAPDKILHYYKKDNYRNDLVHYHHGGKHGSMQADMVLEKELRVLHLDLKATRRRLTKAARRMVSKPIPTV